MRWLLYNLRFLFPRGLVFTRYILVVIRLSLTDLNSTKFNGFWQGILHSVIPL